MRTTRGRLICLVVAAVAALPACGEPSARVSIVFAGRSALTVDRLDVLRLVVKPATAIPTDDRRQEVELDLSADTVAFELELAAGAWLIELIGEEMDDTGSPNTTYFGDRRVDLEPHTEIDLAIPVFPAGTFAAPVWVAGETGIIDAVITFVPRAPRESQSGSFNAMIVPRPDDDSAPDSVDVYDVVRILPTGDYDAWVDATADGISYAPVEGEPIPIVGATSAALGIEHGVVNQWQTPVQIY